jgi:hypothetical protein
MALRTNGTTHENVSRESGVGRELLNIRMKNITLRLSSHEEMRLLTTEVSHGDREVYRVEPLNVFPVWRSLWRPQHRQVPHKKTLCLRL